jgi:hypothetical protein
MVSLPTHQTGGGAGKPFDPYQPLPPPWRSAVVNRGNEVVVTWVDIEVGRASGSESRFSPTTTEDSSTVPHAGGVRTGEVWMKPQGEYRAIEVTS